MMFFAAELRKSNKKPVCYPFFILMGVSCPHLLL